VAPPAPAYGEPRLERLQVERVEVEQPLGLGIGRVEQLEAAVEPEAVDDVGPHPPTDCLGGLEDDGLDAGLLQPDGGGQAGEPGAHDDDVGTRGQRHVANLVEGRRT
jgi:hypothetical protein